MTPRTCCRSRKTQPQTMAAYSVSDAVATYYLYMTYVHPFIFSLATIIPMSPDEVLRKGLRDAVRGAAHGAGVPEGTSCARTSSRRRGEKHYKGHLLESRDVHRRARRGARGRRCSARTSRPSSGCSPKGYQGLLDSLDDDLVYALQTEGKGMERERRARTTTRSARSIAAKLESLRDNPVQMANPLIYHLDVAAMYPNIILTNRLQPPAMVTEDVLRRVRLQPTGEDVPERDGVAVARRALRGDVVGLHRDQGAARGGEVPAARGRLRRRRAAVLGRSLARGAGGGEEGAAQVVLAEGVQARAR